MLKGVSLADWIMLAIGVIGLLTALINRSNRLPANARRWLKQLTPDRFEELIQRAEQIADMSPAERRAWVVDHLQTWATEHVGFPIPTSIANLLVEQVYQLYKRKKARK